MANTLKAGDILRAVDYYNQRREEYHSELRNEKVVWTYYVYGAHVTRSKILLYYHTFINGKQQRDSSRLELTPNATLNRYIKAEYDQRELSGNYTGLNLGELKELLNLASRADKLKLLIS